MRQETEKQLVRLLFGVGINGSHRGYEYIKTAVDCKISNVNLINVYDICDEVAEIHGVASDSVMRCLNWCILQADNFGTLSVLNEVFGENIIFGKMSITSFLNKIVQYLTVFINCA